MSLWTHRGIAAEARASAPIWCECWRLVQLMKGEAERHREIHCSCLCMAVCLDARGSLKGRLTMHGPKVRDHVLDVMLLCVF
mgnify:CR=1 FL=1